MQTPLIKTGDAATLAGVPSRTLNRYRTEGLVVAARFDGEGRSGGAWFTTREVAIAHGVRQVLRLGIPGSVARTFAQRWRAHPEVAINVTNLLSDITGAGDSLPAEQINDAQQVGR